MADQDRPNQNANKSKAEGERLTEPERNGGRNADRDRHPERQYQTPDADEAGGITNRPLSDEIDNQESLPERGTKKDQTSDPGARRQEGDYQEDER
jgi:hypothetical protein